MTHHVFSVSTGDKGAVVSDLARGLGRSVLFTRTKHGAKKLAKQLTAQGIPAVDLHGNLSQGARERNLAAFSDGTVNVLVATDIAARGIHVDDVTLVVHVDPPAEHKAYLHRSGRTARAGAEGSVVTIATHDQAGEVRTLARQAGITPTITSIAPGAREIADLRGERAPHVTPAPVAVIAAPTPRRSPQSRNRSASTHVSPTGGQRRQPRGQRSRRP
jgi:superfamily II DNA/RNA helicase